MPPAPRIVPRRLDRAWLVTLRAGAVLSLAELTAFLRDGGAAAQKLPEQLEVVAELPRTDSGKVHRPVLKARFQ